jgi:diguanylate cyclase (GGDEF)-like protein/PAS domain S-box-containing protein
MWNPSAERILGWKEHEVLGSLLPIVPQNKQEEFRAFREKVLRGESFMGVEIQRQKRDGTLIDISLSAAPMYDTHGQVAGIVGVLTDITERLQMMNTLKITKDFLDTVLKNTKDIILIMDKEYKIEYMNPEAVNCLGYLVGQNCYLAVCKQDKPCQQCGLEEVSKHQTLRTERTIRNKVYDSIIVPFIHDNNTISKMEILRDITERKQLQNELESLSVTDKLTGLYNRRHLDEMLEKEALRANRFNKNLCLLFIDIDKFKLHNDTYGHDEGDKVLQHLGRLVNDNIRNDIDIACRYGGEEFVVILPEASIHDATNVAERILADFRNIKFFIQAQNILVQKTISIGISELISSNTSKMLLVHADKAMYEAKKRGGNSLCKYQP